VNLSSVRARRGLALGAITAVTVAGLTACAGGAGSDGGKVTLNITVTENTSANAIREAAAEYFEETGVEVKVQSFGESQLASQYQVKLNAQSDEIDVMQYRPLQDTRLWESNGWIEDLTDKITADTEWDWDDYADSYADTVSVDDRIYGVPVMTERQVLYYNKAIFDAAGLPVPKTLDELEKTAAALTDKNAGQYGIVLRGQRSAAIPAFSGFLHTLGGDWMTSEGTSAIASDEAIEAYELYGRLLRDYAPEGMTNVEAAQVRALFGQGNVAMMIDPDSIAGMLLDPKESSVADKLGLAPFPTAADGYSSPFNVTSWALAVSAFSKHKDEAWDFIKWMTTKERSAWAMKEFGAPSARVSVWAEAQASPSLPQEIIDIFDLYAEIGNGYDRPPIVEVQKARDIIGGPIVAAIEGQDVKAAAAQADDEFNALLEAQK
jgi:multiple sugar transport system substrate-binding protein